MRFKTPVCQVMCLVITVNLHSATAQHDAFSVEALVTDALQKFEHKIMEKLQAQHMEVIAKQADSIATLVHMLNNLLQAHQLGIPNQLTNVTSDIQQIPLVVDQEKSFNNTVHKLQNGSYAQHKAVIEKLATHATNVQQMAKSIKNLQNITDNLLASLSDVGKELVNESIEWGNQNSKDVIPSSCTTLNTNATGTYSIRPVGTEEPFLVLCDFQANYNLGGGWTVFQRRFNGSVDFYQNWTMYKNGFGDVSGEHWLGLEKLHVMTSSGTHEMLVILEDHDGNAGYALYDSFQIGSEAEKYKLTVGSYTGTVKDALGSHNGMIFTTFDRENDTIDGHNYAARYDGAWWFKQGFKSHLNGKYARSGQHLKPGVIWQPWKGYGYSLKSSKMMLRRRSG